MEHIERILAKLSPYEATYMRCFVALWRVLSTAVEDKEMAPTPIVDRALEAIHRHHERASTEAIDERGRPRIVCLCGPVKFVEAFAEANRVETLAGNIVLSICPNMVDLARAAEMHRKKIDLCDEILVVNVGGYIGEHTRAEIAYAEQKGKAVSYWHRPFQ